MQLVLETWTLGPGVAYSVVTSTGTQRLLGPQGAPPGAPLLKHHWKAVGSVQKESKWTRAKGGGRDREACYRPCISHIQPL